MPGSDHFLRNSADPDNFLRRSAELQRAFPTIPSGLSFTLGWYDLSPMDIRTTTDAELLNMLHQVGPKRLAALRALAPYIPEPDEACAAWVGEGGAA